MNVRLAAPCAAPDGKPLPLLLLGTLSTGPGVSDRRGRVTGEQPEVTRHTQSQENHDFKEKRRSTDTSSKTSQMLEFSDTEFKATVVKVIPRAITNSLEADENQKISAKKKKF